MRRPILMLMAAVLSGAACSSSSGATGPIANEVFLQNSVFNPATRTVASGTVVHFINQDGITHTVTSSSVPSGAAVFNSSLAASAATTLTFTTPGTYQYYCTIHGTPTTGMHATIIVN